MEEQHSGPELREEFITGHAQDGVAQESFLSAVKQDPLAFRIVLPEGAQGPQILRANAGGILHLDGMNA